MGNQLYVIATCRRDTSAWIGYGLSVVGSWLLAIVYGLLAIGCWLLAVGFWLLVVGHCVLAIGS